VSQQEARVRAIGLLYAADAGDLTQIESSDHEGRGFRLARDTWAHVGEIDDALDAASTEWRVGRMPAVDRAILRLAVYELRYTETPVGVILSEAVDLAKEYSTADSGRFVNGVLAAIAARERAEA
jgi:transcription antitermination protein NusB